MSDRDEAILGPGYIKSSTTSGRSEAFGGALSL